MNLGLRGKTALITGGSRGIGFATALELAREGCRVAVCARDAKQLKSAVRSLQKISRGSFGFPCDVLRPSDIEVAIGRIAETWRGVDILINNVGGGGRWGEAEPERTSPGVWREVYDKNTTSATRFTMAFLPHMMRKRWGRVVTVTSIYGREAGGRPWFNMAKAAQISLMKSLAGQSRLARSGITFNSVAPGNLLIPKTGWDELRLQKPARFKALVEKMSPLGRLGTAGEVAGLIAFLCSRRAGYINGACIAIDGGEGRSF